MKRQLILLCCVLTSIAALAQTWNFQNGLTQTDIDNLNADGTNWTYESSNNRYLNAGTLNNEELKANGSVLQFAKGLLLSATKADQVRLDNKKKSLTLNNSAATLVIPNLKAGQVVTISGTSSSSSTARTLNPENLTVTAGFVKTTSADSQTNVGTVTTDGDVSLKPDGGYYIYSINVETPGESGGETEGDKNSNAVAKDINENQMALLLTDNDIKYYNVSAIKSLDIDGGTVTVTPYSGDADVYYSTVSDITFKKAEQGGNSGEVTNPEGVVTITAAKGWLESAYVAWTPYAGAESYVVYVKGGQYGTYTKLDQQLVRNYGTYGRADVVGLKASDNYAFKVVPVVNKEEYNEGANEVTNIKVANYKREGFCFMDGAVPGAYNTDGTLKANARVIYVTAKTAKTISLPVKTSSKGEETRTGLQNILAAFEKGYEDRPLAVRIIGTLRAEDMDAFGSSAEGIQIKGKNNTIDMNVTIEGIGEDAAIYGFGLLLRNAVKVELRNFAVMLCLDDCVSLDTDNKYCWVHHLDLFYGKTGSASDQAKGDGTLDVKSDSQYMTFSANHLWDSGKASLCGMKSESGENFISYDNNWFDHSDSRHPRVRTMTVHVWNNYYDGVAKYGVGATSGSNVFVDRNYFRAVNRPMMSSKQGTDATGDGTFSGEAGGMIKSYGNVFAERSSKFSYITHKDNAVSFDAYEASERNEVVPDSYKTLAGGTTYNNFDIDDSKMYAYTPLDATDVPAAVTGWYGAGRMNHGDFQWRFNNAVDDTNYDVNNELKAAITAYKSSLVGIFGDDAGNNDDNISSGDDNGDDNGGDSGDNSGDNGGEQGETIECHFTGKTASNTFFTISGNYSDSKGTATVDGTTYTDCLKMESATSVKFTTSTKMTLTLYFASTETSKGVKINGKKYTTDSNAKVTVELEAGSHEITKGDSINLFFIKLQLAE